MYIIISRTLVVFKDSSPIILNFKIQKETFRQFKSARKVENSSKRRLNLNSRSQNRLPEPFLTIQWARIELDLG